MRKILFRGKGKAKAITGCPYNNGKPDGEWVFGYVFPDLGAMKIRQYEIDKPECNGYEVDPETVGQYTGVTDENGVKIFEGDILRDDDTEENGVVVFEEGEFCVVFDNVITHGISAITYRCYIRGNIHDNPELIGG